MKKIVVVGDFGLSMEQKERLERVGEVSYILVPNSSDEWLEKVQGMDVICSDGDYLLENLEKLENVFVTYPYIELGSFDSKKLAERGVYVANTRGSNKNSIVEWVLFMTLALFRDFIPAVNATESMPFTRTRSLENKKVLIVGKGNIGTQIGKICGAFGMNVDFYTREDNLIQKIQDVDLIINALTSNPTSKNLLNEEFFMSVKKGANFISFVRPHTYDLQGLLKSLDAGVMGKAALDADPEASGDTTNDFYRAALAQEKILVTPHVAFATEEAGITGNEFLVQNVENFLKGKPSTVVEK